MGVNFVPAYEISGVPYVTSSAENEVTTSALRINFPFVTRWVEVVNTGDSPLRIGFSANGVIGQGASVSGSKHESTANHANYFVLETSGSTSQARCRWELRCSDIFFATKGGTSSFSLVAGLTGIPKKQLLTLTGSDGFVGIG
jgi:hypothetical protein